MTGLARPLRGAAAFVRLSALGGTFALVAAGAATADRRPSLPTTGGLAGMAVLFHSFAYITNDVIDVEVDRSEPRRASTPLVTGAVPPLVALALAAIAAAGSIAIATHLAGPAGGLTASAAVAGLAVYDVWGKRCPWPPATDFVQGVGWAALVITAALGSGDATAGTWWLGAATVWFILLANGVHGALRDIDNDARHLVRSTALWAGASSNPDGSIFLPRLLRTHAFVLHWLTSASILASMFAAGAGTQHLALWAAVVIGAAVVGHVVLGTAATGPAGATRNAGMLHLVGLLGLFVVAAGARLPAGPAIAIGAAYLVPLGAHGWSPDLARWLWRRGAVGDLARLVRLPNAAVAALATVIGGHLSRSATPQLPVVWRGAVAVALVVAFGNAANDLADVAVDRLRRPDRPLPSGRLSVGAAKAVAAAAAAGSLALAATLPIPAAMWVLATLAASLLYDRRLKSTVLAGNALVALLSASTIPFGAVLAGGRIAPAALGASLVFAFMLAFEVLKDVDDRDADAAAGLRTVATVLGPVPALRISRALPGALVAVGLAGWWLGVAPAHFLALAVPATLGPAVAASLMVRRGPNPAAVRAAITVLKGGWLSGLGIMLFLR